MARKFAFVTCVQLGLACMEEIYRVGGKLDLVITLKDEIAPRKSGRIYVDSFCAQHDIDTLKVTNINEEQALHEVQSRAIDWMFVIGWSQIVRVPMLHTPRRGSLGMHPTLLPVGRGRAAIPWAILKRLPETGVTLFQLDEGVDTGPILAQERLPMAPDETATTLYQRVVEAHRKLMASSWTALAQDRLQGIPQNETRASCWPARKPEDGRLVSSMSVATVECMVRAVTRPYPGCFFEREQDTIRIWTGQVGSSSEPAPEGALRFTFQDGVYDALEYDVEPFVA